MRILLSVPNRLQADSIEHLLRSDRRFEVLGEVSNARRLPTAIRRLIPQILLIDLTTSLMPGLEIVTRCTEESPRTQVVALLPVVYTRHRRLLCRSGVSRFMHHEADANDLVNAILDAAIGHHCPPGGHAECCRTGYGRHVSHFGDSRPLADSPDLLSEREREVWHFLVRGYTSRETGVRLCISARTVETHIGSLFRKLVLNDARQASCALYKDEDSEVEAPPLTDGEPGTGQSPAETGTRGRPRTASGIHPHRSPRPRRSGGKPVPSARR